MHGDAAYHWCPRSGSEMTMLGLIAAQCVAACSGTALVGNVREIGESPNAHERHLLASLDVLWGTYGKLRE